MSLSRDTILKMKIDASAKISLIYNVIFKDIIFYLLKIILAFTPTHSRIQQAHKILSLFIFSATDLSIYSLLCPPYLESLVL
jgi:hypothetical protein